jgi:hypothetical protein
MVCVKFTTALFAHLTRIVISLENSGTPLSVFNGMSDGIIDTCNSSTPKIAIRPFPYLGPQSFFPLRRSLNSLQRPTSPL